MKKVFAIALIAISFAACNNNSDKKETTDTTTTVAPAPTPAPDTTKMVDTSAHAMDTTKMK